MADDRTALAGIIALCLEMGHVIRYLDEGGEWSEWWTHDGNPGRGYYNKHVADGRFDDAIICLAGLSGNMRLGYTSVEELVRVPLLVDKYLDMLRKET